MERLGRIYRGRCEAARLANGVEIVTEEDFATLAEGDQLDVRMPGEGPHYTFDMSEPGDLVRGIFVAPWSTATFLVGLRRVERCRFRLSMTEAHADLIAARP